MDVANFKTQSIIFLGFVVGFFFYLDSYILFIYYNIKKLKLKLKNYNWNDYNIINKLKKKLNNFKNNFIFGLFKIIILNYLQKCYKAISQIIQHIYKNIIKKIFISIIEKICYLSYIDHSLLLSNHFFINL